MKWYLVKYCYICKNDYSEYVYWFHTDSAHKVLEAEKDRLCFEISLRNYQYVRTANSIKLYHMNKDIDDPKAYVGEYCGFRVYEFSEKGDLTLVEVEI